MPSATCLSIGTCIFSLKAPLALEVQTLSMTTQYWADRDQPKPGLPPGSTNVGICPFTCLTSAICRRCYQGHLRIHQPTGVRDRADAEYIQGKGGSHKDASWKPPFCVRSCTRQISPSCFPTHQADSDSRVMHHWETITGFHAGQEGIFLISLMKRDWKGFSASSVVS